VKPEFEEPATVRQPGQFDRPVHPLSANPFNRARSEPVEMRAIGHLSKTIVSMDSIQLKQRQKSATKL
jgi:hypothetical protein